MKSILRIVSFKRCINLSVAVLILLIVFSFYGLYTNTFYLLKPANYIFPLLALVHFTFLYVLKFKIRENELTDPPMRNLEYLMYGVFIVYTVKAFEAFYILTTFGSYSNHVIPNSFIPMGILIFTLYLFLLALTLITFKYRKTLVGSYKFDDMNQQIDSWE